MPRQDVVVVVVVMECVGSDNNMILNHRPPEDITTGCQWKNPTTKLQSPV